MRAGLENRREMGTSRNGKRPKKEGFAERPAAQGRAQPAEKEEGHLVVEIGGTGGGDGDGGCLSHFQRDVRGRGMTSGHRFDRWFSDAEEFVGELTGMATRRAMIDNMGMDFGEAGLLPCMAGVEIVSAAKDDGERDQRDDDDDENDGENE